MSNWDFFIFWVVLKTKHMKRGSNKYRNKSLVVVFVLKIFQLKIYENIQLNKAMSKIYALGVLHQWFKTLSSDTGFELPIKFLEDPL